MQTETTSLSPNQILFGLAILAFFALLIMEKLKPYRHFADDVSKASFYTNTSAFLFNNVILTTLRATSLFFVAQKYSAHGLLSGLANNNPIKWILALLLYDLAIYFWHFISHKYLFLWRFHKVHHSDKSFNVSTGFRFHVFDLFLEIPYKCLFVILIGVDAYLVLVIESIQLFFIFFHHSNITFKNEKQVSAFIITPFLHRAHHSTLRSEHDNNYGIIFSFWDSLFGTRIECVPEKIGLSIVIAENFMQLFSLAFITEKNIKKIFYILPKKKN